ncbi:hypothetical protein CDD81_4712 [Ophiocordyceps australis]|uniref:glucan endo-1,3-beta-D-glucosidase n=1 Tax=Ophiocordyceps australis TaxID=1399860 RepID=A0A2C5Y4D2_9HYPO|nr:hypothetical protein CDD81_4712 [Ophiocordyceps australis]
MQPYPSQDPYERLPLGTSRYDASGRPPTSNSNGYNGQEYNQPYYDDVSPRPYVESPPSSTSSHLRSYQNEHPDGPMPPRHADYNYHNGDPSRGPYDGQVNSAPRGMGAPAYINSPEDSYGTNQIPPPPSRAHYPNASRQQYPPPNAGFYSPYQPPADRDSHSTLNPFGTPSGTHSPARSLHSFGRGDSMIDDPYQAYGSNPRHPVLNLGIVDPNSIEDDGDDGLHYSRKPPRSSMLGASKSDNRAGIGAAAVTSAAAGGLLAKNGPDGRTRGVDSISSQEKRSSWINKKEGRSKKCKWLTIIIVGIVIVGAIVGGVVGSFVAGNNKSKSKPSGDSADDDSRKNGDLDINSSEIKNLLNNADLHKVFPGMDYTPLNSQYPDCMHNPPSQNNITRDVAVLSQLTNKIRLYGTDCNQTEMVIHAVNQLKMTQDVKIWMGVWQDNNKTTNARQLDQMWNILDKYGDDQFEGIIVANEVLYRKDMDITTLAKVLSDVRTNLTQRQMKLPVATSDLGDDWTAALGDDSDYIMANIHPFFAGVSAETAASWTWSFWKNRNGDIWKSDKQKNIISETGWPSAGGKNCGGAMTQTCDPGSVAGIDEMNRFMNDWVCQALDNGTNYFWFEAFDEPWKIRFNEKGKEWEDKWGLMDTNRKLKPGVKIPDCGGKTV